MLKRIADDNWGSAFCFAKPEAVPGYDGPTNPFTRNDVVQILAIADGDNDGPSWVGVFLLADGRFASLSAGCDYTGWDCQAGGCAFVAGSQEDIFRFGVDDWERSRLLCPGSVFGSTEDDPELATRLACGRAIYLASLRLPSRRRATYIRDAGLRISRLVAAFGDVL